MRDEFPRREHATVDAGFSGGCEYCSEFKLAQPPPSVRDFLAANGLSSRALYADRDFVIFPSIGALDATHVLLATVEHATAFSELPSALLARAESLLGLVRDRLDGRAPMVYFEHGSACGALGGQCIDHAHMHCIRTTCDLARRVESLGPAVHLESLADIQRIVGPYLFARSGSGANLVVQPRSIPSQYIRREVCAELGIPDEWDWAVFPRWHNLAAALEAWKGEPK